MQFSKAKQNERGTARHGLSEETVKSKSIMELPKLIVELTDSKIDTCFDLFVETIIPTKVENLIKTHKVSTKANANSFLIQSLRQYRNPLQAMRYEQIFSQNKNVLSFDSAINDFSKINSSLSEVKSNHW